MKVGVIDVLFICNGTITGRDDYVVILIIMKTIIIIHGDKIMISDDNDDEKTEIVYSSFDPIDLLCTSYFI